MSNPVIYVSSIYIANIYGWKAFRSFPQVNGGDDFESMDDAKRAVKKR